MNVRDLDFTIDCDGRDGGGDTAICLRCDTSMKISWNTSGHHIQEWMQTHECKPVQIWELHDAVGTTIATYRIPADGPMPSGWTELPDGPLLHLNGTTVEPGWAWVTKKAGLLDHPIHQP